MKTFNVPDFYRSPIITKAKQYRKIQDPRKRDNSPTVLNFGKINYLIARHFGFCYGVENAIEISYKAIEENEGKRIFLMSPLHHHYQKMGYQEQKIVISFCIVAIMLSILTIVTLKTR